MTTTNIPEEYFRAGRIAAEVREYYRHRDLVGMSVLELCEEVEAMIRSKGGEPAFPCNVGIDAVAAHYTAWPGDPLEVREGSVVKLDLGVHIGGYIADTAVTLCFNPELEPLVEAAEGALKAALGAIREGVRAGDVGRAVEGYARRRGFQVIRNLSGHTLSQYRIHGGISIPNIGTPLSPTLKAGEVYAVEPFLTTLEGAGEVAEGEEANIYALISRRRVKDRRLQALVETLWERFRTLPFTPRWLQDLYRPEELQALLGRLVALRVVHAYPVLVEARGRPVAQFEHTVTPIQGGTLIITTPNTDQG